MDIVPLVALAMNAVLIFGLMLWLVRSRNRLVRLRGHAEAAWAQVDVQLARRDALIPQLLGVARLHAAHELDVIELLTSARDRASVRAQAGSPDRPTVELGLTRLARRLVERQPKLRADSNFLRLQEEMSIAEDKIAFARQFYNLAVRNYNAAMESLPTSLLTRTGRFTAYQYFAAVEVDAGQ